MDRALLEKFVRDANRHVAEGEEHIRKQRELVARLGRHGHDTSSASELLATFEQLQLTHVRDRDRLVKELEAASRPQ
jgi:hypothetical protein